jgi:hypothetical protein
MDDRKSPYPMGYIDIAPPTETKTQRTFSRSVLTAEEGRGYITLSFGWLREGDYWLVEINGPLGNPSPVARREQCAFLAAISDRTGLLEDTEFSFRVHKAVQTFCGGDPDVELGRRLFSPIGDPAAFQSKRRGAWSGDRGSVEIELPSTWFIPPPSGFSVDALTSLKILGFVGRSGGTSLQVLRVPTGTDTQIEGWLNLPGARKQVGGIWSSRYGGWELKAGVSKSYKKDSPLRGGEEKYLIADSPTGQSYVISFALDRAEARYVFSERCLVIRNFLGTVGLDVSKVGEKSQEFLCGIPR